MYDQHQRCEGRDGVLRHGECGTAMLTLVCPRSDGRDERGSAQFRVAGHGFGHVGHRLVASADKTGR